MRRNFKIVWGWFIFVYTASHIESGAMTWAFLNSFQISTSWSNLVENMRLKLKNNYTQIPLLSYNNGNIADQLF
jgi:hypothetical protein